MSFLTVLPDMVATSAENLVDVCSTLGVANAAAAVPTTGIAAAASDEVSTAIATLFGSYAQGTKPSAPGRQHFMTSS